MPQALLGFVGMVGGWLITGTVAVFGEAAAIFILDLGAKIAGLQFLGWLSGKLTPTPDVSQTAVSQSILVRGTVEHQRIIYGEVLVGGTIAYLNTAGTHNQSLYHAILFAGHQIEDVTDVWLDNEIIPSAAIDWSGNGSVDSGWLAGDLALQTTAYFNKYLGTSNQTASAPLISAFSEITSQHQGRNIAYLVSRFDYFEGQTQVWSAGPPQQIRGLVKGKKVYDPRSDSTQSFGTGPHRVNSIPTWAYSNNPALCWADYMIDSRLGVGVAPSKIDYGYVASAANVCDTVVFTPVGTDVRFSCNGVLFTSTQHEGNVAAILSSFNGSQTRVNGTYKVRAFSYSTPTLQFDENDLRGDAQFSLDPDENDRYNTVRGIFIDKDRLWESAQFPAFTASEYVARDGGNVKFEDIQLPMTTDVYAAQRLAAGILERSDMTTTVIYPATFNAMPAEINGTIKLSNAKMNWTDKEFRVINYSVSDNKGIDLVLREDSVSAYTDVATNEYTVSSQGSYVTANPGVPAPSSLWLVGGGSFIGVNWTTPPARLYETVRVYAARTSSWSDANIVGDVRGASFEHKVDAPTSYWYWVQAVNFAGELSNRLPNSDYSAVGGNANPYDAYDNYTFDKSAVNTDFFESTDLSSGWMIVSSAGSNATNGMRIIKSTAAFFQYAGRTFYPLADHQIISDTMKLRVRYKVESTNGYSFPNSAGLYLAAFAWQINTPAPPTYPPKLLPGDRQLVVLDSKFWPVASLATAGTWGYVEATLATSGSWVDGHKLGKPACGISVLSGSSQYFQIIFDDLSFRYT